MHARNNADALVFNLEKQMREHDAKISDGVKKKVNTKIEDMKDLLKKENVSAQELKKATDELATEAQEIGKMIYEAASKESKETSSSVPHQSASDRCGTTEDKKEAKESRGKENVVDAEVVEDKDDNK